MRGKLCGHLPNDVAACLHPVVEDGEAGIADEILETHDFKCVVKVLKKLEGVDAEGRGDGEIKLGSSKFLPTHCSPRGQATLVNTLVNTLARFKLMSQLHDHCIPLIMARMTACRYWLSCCLFYVGLEPFGSILVS